MRDEEGIPKGKVIQNDKKCMKNLKDMDGTWGLSGPIQIGLRWAFQDSRTTGRHIILQTAYGLPNIIGQESRNT